MMICIGLSDEQGMHEEPGWQSTGMQGTRAGYGMQAYLACAHAVRRPVFRHKQL